MKLQIENLRFAYKSSNTVLRDIHMQALPGEITALIGPNAAGKSTLLKCLAGVLRPEGNILLDGKEMSKFKKKDIARYVSYLPQESSSRALLTVFEAVLLGRLQSLSWRVSKADLTIALKVMQDLEIEELAPRFLDELSGGQKQMVSIAQALVRESRVLLLDEPVSGLDLQHQLEILNLITAIVRDKGISAIMAVHDLNLASQFSDKIIILREGGIYAAGEPGVVLTPENIKAVYGVDTIINENSGRPHIIPIGVSTR